MVVLTLLANFFTNSNVVNNHFLEYYYQLLDAWLYKKTRPVLCCEKIFFFFFSGFLELKYVCIDFIMEILFVLSHKSPKDISVLEIKKQNI
ncbi:hypothetical protein CPARA_1gp027 (nucleomorph) [Cryptomonas paramecium]|uniref:Uncharacterized protein n=1 Tax=Cryptomonas paramaecium TaxID=2898 RepID=F2HH89_9CRYP|nr:hypothetical protein CPARA_1gp027 [Cryptomonas paramecium]AEA38685.1 hypothetical protein CPARA_1gp027 [Cryptomonas paramecium]